ncbi:MAG: NnrU family protein [Gammaproteobacteria bacterium]
MWVLILGLVLFLGAHSARMLAGGWRQRQIERLGERGWKGTYALVSIVGFVLIVWGFGMAREHAVQLYVPAAGMRHLNSLFTLIAFVLIAAAYVPRNHIKTWVGHPMLAGVAFWAFGHLLATGALRDLLLFGLFLVWAVADFVVSRLRDSRLGAAYPAGMLRNDVLTLIVGVVAWAVFAFWLHQWLIGVSPFG